jgi:hypothetical protein
VGAKCGGQWRSRSWVHCGEAAGNTCRLKLACTGKPAGQNGHAHPRTASVQSGTIRLSSLQQQWSGRFLWATANASGGRRWKQPTSLVTCGLLCGAVHAGSRPGSAATSRAPPDSAPSAFASKGQQGIVTIMQAQCDLGVPGREGASSQAEKVHPARQRRCGTGGRQASVLQAIVGGSCEGVPLLKQGIAGRLCNSVLHATMLQGGGATSVCRGSHAPSGPGGGLWCVRDESRS